MREPGSKPADALRLELIGEAEGGRLSRAGRLYVLETRGSARSRGRQHGSLLGEEVRAGVARLLSRRAFDLTEIRNAHPEARVALEAFVTQMYAGIEASISAYQRDELLGLAESSGLSFETLFRASFLSEALQHLASAGSAREEAAANGACTAAVIVGDRAAGGGSVHGKNQDYDGGGLWDLYPLVHIAHPEEGFAHISATSVGLIKGNLTLNAAGVTIGGHFLFSSEAGRTGRSFTTLEREVALRARSVAEALDILRAKPCSGSFAFVITDQSGEAAVAECDGEGVRVRDAEEGWLGMSNLFSTLHATDKDLLRRWGAHRNPLSRQARVDQCGADLPVPADARDIAAILADRFDPASNRRRGPAHVIAHAMTVTAAVVETASLRFWVGEATAPASHGRFIGFDCEAALRAGGSLSLCGEFESGAAKDAACIAGFRSFLRAREAFKAGDELAARAALVDANEVDSSEAAYPRFLARLLIRAGNYAATEDCITRAAASVQGCNERAECALIAGFSADLRGDRESALQRYRQVEEMARAERARPFDWINPKLAQAARNAAERPFDHDQARVLEAPFDLTSGIE